MSRGRARVLLWMLTIMLASRAPLVAQPATPERAADGTVTGKVIDKSTGDPIIEAGVEVVDVGKRTRTDLDGKYKLQLPAGTYQLRIFAPLYRGTRLQNVVVRAAQVTQSDATLAPEGAAAVEVVEVVAQADKATEAAQLLQRQKSAVVEDNISAQSIQKSPDKNAADVVKRVPAVTIQNGKFVFVRGLGERYTSAVLNSSRLPSTDPDRRVVPLDLFPAEFMESLSVIKTYTPDLPGDFSGGLVDIKLREYPEQLSYGIGMQTTVNTNASFQPFDTYRGSQYDYFGFGADFRDQPRLVPDNLSGHKVSGAQGRFYNSQFKNVWDVDKQTSAPNYRLNFAVGDSVDSGGFSLAGIYGTEYKERWNEFNQVFHNNGKNPDGSVKIDPFGDLTANRSTFETRLGGVLTAGWKFGPTDGVSFRALVDRNSFDEVIDGIGHNRNLELPTGQSQGQPIAQSKLQYTADQLGFGQLAGEHRWPHLEVNWRTALSQTTQDQPDTRFVAYSLPPNNGSQYRQLFASNDSGPTSLERLFGRLDEYLTDSAVDFTVPFTTGLPFTDVWSGLPAKFKFGPAYVYRRRTFDYHRFVYDRLPSANLSPFQRSQSPEIQLGGDSIGANFDFQGGDRPGDSFTATQEIAAFYGMFDLPLVRDRLRLVAGVRTEYSYIRSSAFGSPQILDDVDPLPGVNLIYNPRGDMDVRFAYSRTVSRPEFRELTPTLVPALEGEFDIIGNPLLTSATIDSYDLRWDWYQSPVEVLSASVFYKDLSDPIENVIVGESAGEAVSFANAKGGATLYGFEVEAQKNLGFLVPQARRFGMGVPEWLTHVNFLMNVAYIESEVNIGSNVLVQVSPPPAPPVSTVQTNPKRALQGQAPYVVNAALEYNSGPAGIARLLYNTVGPRIVFAGTDELPDIFEEPRNSLDLVLLKEVRPFGAPVTAKLSVENMLNDTYDYTQGDNVTHSYKTGVKFTFGLSYAY